MKKKLFALIMAFAFVLVGCGTPQSGNTYIVPQQINEPKISDITPVFETQIERVNNCDGTNPTYNVSYKTIEAQKASFEVSVGAGGLVTGTPIPSVLEVQLEAKITAALAKDYGLTTEKNHDLTLENVQGTFLEHTITWKVTRVKGLIEVIYGDGIAQVGFDKIASVELYNRTSKPLGCDGNAVNVPSIPSETQSPITISSEYFFEDGCINKTKWALLQGNTTFENNNCWNLDSKGIFAIKGKGLSIIVNAPPSSSMNGLVTSISSDTDVSFDMEISELTTPSDWNTNVAIGLLPSAASTPSQYGTSILFQSGSPNKPIWMMLQIPGINQIYLPPPRISLNKVYNVKLEIRGTRLITYLNYEIVDDRNLAETHPFLWVGYTVSQGGTLSVKFTNFSLVSK